jgi:hypothetical protein
VIEVVVEEGNDEQSPNGIYPTSIQACSGCTMQIYVFINDTTLQALLDSRSTHNFVGSEAVSRAGIVFAAQHSLRVVVANGDHIASSGCCCNLKISIADEDFIIDCYGLALGSYEWSLVSNGWLHLDRSSGILGSSPCRSSGMGVPSGGQHRRRQASSTRPWHLAPPMSLRSCFDTSRCCSWSP